MAHVFISYVHQNADLVDRLCQSLRAAGAVVWLDRSELEPGTRWRAAIRDAIKSGAYFIACFSREYNDRSKTYMNEELTLAIEELRQRPTDTRWFIPVLLNDASLPSREISAAETLHDLQVLPLYRNWDDGIARLIRLIGRDDPDQSRMWYLLDAIEQPYQRERRHAIEELGRGKYTAQPVLDALANVMLADEENEVAAHEAVRAIGPGAAPLVPLVSNGLHDDARAIRSRAANTLQAIGPAAVSALPQLIRILEEDLGDKKAPTARAPYFESRGMDFSRLEYDQEAAVDALCAFGASAHEAVPALSRALERADLFQSVPIVAALTAIGLASNEVVPALGKALSLAIQRGSSELLAGRMAALGLGELGTAAEEVLPILFEATQLYYRGPAGREICISARDALASILDAARAEEPSPEPAVRLRAQRILESFDAAAGWKG